MPVERELRRDLEEDARKRIRVAVSHLEGLAIAQAGEARRLRAMADRHDAMAEAYRDAFDRMTGAIAACGRPIAVSVSIPPDRTPVCVVCEEARS